MQDQEASAAVVVSVVAVAGFAEGSVGNGTARKTEGRKTQKNLPTESGLEMVTDTVANVTKMV